MTRKLVIASVIASLSFLIGVPPTFVLSAPRVIGVHVSTGRATLTVRFDRDLVDTSVNLRSVALVRAGADGVIGTADDVSLRRLSLSLRQPNVQDLMRHTSGWVSAGRGNTPLHDRYPGTRNVHGPEDYLAKLALLLAPPT